MDFLHAWGDSVITLHGYDFWASAGLYIDGGQVTGQGVLVGIWADGTHWTTAVSNWHGATILLVPEPATLSLLAVGGLALLRRKRG